jgi:hypothetical protein
MYVFENTWMHILCLFTNYPSSHIPFCCFRPASPTRTAWRTARVDPVEGESSWLAPSCRTILRRPLPHSGFPWPPPPTSASSSLWQPLSPPPDLRCKQHVLRFNPELSLENLHLRFTLIECLNPWSRALNNFKVKHSIVSRILQIT